MKEKTLEKKDERKECEKSFSMGKDVHISKRRTTLNFFDEEQTFYIVPDDFLLHKEGILTINF